MATFLTLLLLVLVTATSSYAFTPPTISRHRTYITRQPSTPSDDQEKETTSVDLSAISSRKKLNTEDIGAEFTDFKSAPSSVFNSDEDGSRTAELVERGLDVDDEWKVRF